MNALHTLDDAERSALEEALDDEYKSHATYDQVIRDFSPERPFINIVDAETRHISALLGLFDKYAIAAPVDRWTGNVARYATLTEACIDSAQGEIDNVALYDRLLQSTARPDVLAVFQALQAASQDRHLPAFQRCVARGR